SRPRQNLQETTHNLPGSCKCINNFPLQTLAAKGSPDCSGSTKESGLNNSFSESWPFATCVVSAMRVCWQVGRLAFEA
ncbi:hypothetical protein, partial [Paraburkholderia sp. BR10954]|uniref:hypothetical protein n=1 Tax=Paraburkholderia sp. BR10954 TaxID=3236995 RepID=UPI0034D1ECB5